MYQDELNENAAPAQEGVGRKRTRQSSTKKPIDTNGEELEDSKGVGAQKSSSMSAKVEEESDDSSSDDDEEDGEEEEDESEDEAVKGPAAAKKPKNTKKRRTNALSSNGKELDSDRSNCETGQIVRIQFKNFMCHRTFDQSFGKKLNFLTGRNGSGKSAIAVGLQLCLGGNCNSTGRGSSFKGLVREGHQGAAELMVTLSNEGPDAYKPDTYGKRITIKRILRRDGASNYEIKGEDGVTHSREKAELLNITRALSIHVSNPCCVLTQENAKVFVQGNSKKKYTFFMQAAGLSLLGDQLVSVKETLLEAIEEQQLLEPKVLVKQENMKKMQQKLKRYEKLDKLEEEIQQCGLKIVWVDVKSAEEILSGVQEILVERESILLSAQSELTSYTADGGEGENARLAAQLQELKQRNAESLQQQEDCELLLVQRRQAVRDMQSQVQSAQQQLHANRLQKTQHEQRMRSVQKELLELNEQAKRNSEAEEREVRDKIGSCELELVELREHSGGSVQSQRAEINSKLRTVHEAVNRITTSIRMDSSQLTTLRSDLTNLTTSGQNKAERLHRGLTNVLNHIQQHSSEFSAPVLGPVGLFTKIKEGHEHCATALERVLGARLKNFVVTNSNDRHKLYGMLKQLRCEKTYIIMIQPPTERFNIAPIENTLVVADVLVFEGPDEASKAAIYNALIDQLGIDNIAVVKDIETIEHEYVTRDNSGNNTLRDGIRRCVTFNGTTLFYNSGNRMVENMRMSNNQNILSSDVSAVIARVQQELQQKTDAVQQSEQQKANLNRQVAELQQQLHSLDEEARNRDAVIRRKEREVDALKEKLLEVQAAGTVDTSFLENERDELTACLQALESSSEQLQQELAAAQSEVALKKKERDAVEQQQSEIAAELDQQQAEISDINNAQRELKRKAVQMQKQVDKCQAEVLNAEREVRRKEIEYNNALQKAQQQMRNELGDDWNGEPLPVRERDSVAALNKQREKKKQELLIGKRELQVEGFTKDVLLQRVQRAVADYESHRVKWEDLSTKITLLNNDMEERTKKYDKVLKQSFKKAKEYFDYYLLHQSFKGEILYDHEEKTLDLLVQTDMKDENSKNSHVGNLSGGERSLVTFCFLLALGHVMESPFRIMDEYDVYMDETKRQITLTMLQEYITQPGQSSRQFIVITPHKIRGIPHSTNDVRMLKMPDPRKSGGVNTSAQGLQQQTLD